MVNHHIDIDAKKAANDNTYNYDSNLKKYKENKDKGSWLNLYHADWCGHCRNIMPTWDNYVNNSKNNNTNINTVKIESSHLSTLGKEINGYPTITLSYNGDEIDYNGDRTLESLENFVNSKGQSGGRRKKRSKKYMKKKHMKKKRRTKNRKKKLNKKSRRKHRGGGILDTIETKLQTLENMIGNQSFE